MKKAFSLAIGCIVISVFAFGALSCNPDNSSKTTENIPPVTQTLKSGNAGTLTLSNGSSVTVPAGLFGGDVSLNLSFDDAPTTNFPNKAVADTGPAVVFTITNSLSSRIFEAIFSNQRVEAASPVVFDVHLTLPRDSIKSVEQAIPYVEVTEKNGSQYILGVDSKLDSGKGIVDIKVPLLRPQETKQVKVGHADIPAVEKARLPMIGGRVLENGLWTDQTGNIKPSGRTLVVVHGMMSTIDEAFKCASTLKAKGKYDQVVGFNYDWTKGIEESGKLLADFLAQLKKAGVTDVDIEAHSEGVPVSLSAYAQTNISVNNMVLLGGPIMGTPAAMRAEYLQYQGCLSTLIPTAILNWGQEHSFEALTGRSLKQLANGKFAEDLRPGSVALSNIRKSVAQKMGQSGVNTKVIAVAGTDPTTDTKMRVLGSILKDTGAFIGEDNDGIVGKNSALGRTPDGKDGEIPMTRKEFQLSHTDLECDPGVQNAVAKELKPFTTSSAIVVTTTTARNPDLTVTSVSFTPTSVSAGQTLSVTFTVMNQGGTASGPFRNRVSLATTAYGTDYSLGNFDMESLAPNQSKTATVTTSGIPAAVPAGSYWVTVFTDVFQLIDESDEQNNIGSLASVKVLSPTTAVNIQTWSGRIGGNATYQGPGSFSYMWQSIDYSFSFDVTLTAAPPQGAYGSTQGTASMTGNCAVLNAIKSTYAIQDKRVGTVTGGTLTGGNELQATVYNDRITLSTPNGGPYLVFGQYSHNTWEGSGNLWSQYIYLTIEKRTDTQISGHWSFDSRYSTGTILPYESSGYTFTLNRQP